METRQFLETVVTGTEGYFLLALSNGASGWLEHWYKWPNDIDTIVAKADEHKNNANVYFSSYLFRAPQSTKSNVLASRTIQADLDNADVDSLPLPPNVLVETSPGRHQAYWILREAVGLEEHERLSRKLTYAIAACDRSGWPLGRKVRIINTFNHKYLDGLKAVKVMRVSDRLFTQDDFEPLPEIHSFVSEQFDEEFIENPKSVERHPLELLEDIKDAIPVKVYIEFSNRQEDRSEALWALMCHAFKAGMSREQVFTLAQASANNKFADLRHRASQDLAKDILRAEAEVKNVTKDPRQTIQDICKLQIPPGDRKRQILTVVLKMMRDQGQFFNCDNGHAFYIRRDVGRPIAMTIHGDHINSMLDIQYGLNPTEPEAKFVIAGLRNYVVSLPQTSLFGALSFYDTRQQHILLHTGRRDVLRITKDKIDSIVDGAHDTVFTWSPSIDPFNPLLTDNTTDWGEELFGNGTRGFGTSVENVSNMTPEQAMAILKVWFMFILVRQCAPARPILATLGQPGCLSGDTILGLRRGEHSERPVTIRDAYRKLHGLPAVGREWQPGIRTRIRSLKNTTIEWRDVRDIVSSGRKETYTVLVEGSEPFRATLDHRFMTPDGYKPLSDLVPGSLVIVQGLNSDPNEAEFRTRRIVRADFHPHARHKIVNGYGPYGNILYCRAVLEADLNGISLDEYLHIVHRDVKRVGQLKFLPGDTHIHHNDLNPENDDLYNLEPMTKAQHDRLHGSSNKVNLREFSGVWDALPAKVLSITHHGVEDTYDVQMADDEAPNFVVNHVVVHNSGKSTLHKKVYCVLYGPRKSIGSVTNPDDLDHSVSNDPLVVLDNVDTWEKWLPDRLALAAGTSDVTKRKLYTDSDTVTLKRQAVLGVTAHNPKFGREDVADRFLLLSYRRLNKFVSEQEIYSDLLTKRDEIWGAVIGDLQRMLNEPMPVDNIPQFRIEDFARTGLWIARAIGCEDKFREAVEDVKTAQQTFTLEEEGLLVNAVQKLAASVKERKVKPEWRTSAQLWSMLELNSADSKAFGIMYRNAVTLSKKLSSMQSSLKKIVRIEQQASTDGVRQWLIGPLEEDDAE